MKKLFALILALVLAFSVAAFAETEEEFFINEWYALDRSAVGENGVVSSARSEASVIGAEIMKAGGNAVDAAVATAFAVGVCEPFSNGLGGGGFMTLHTAEGEDIFIDFREYAPAAATDTMYIDENGEVDWDAYTFGGKAVAIPGTVAGLLYILENYGTMTREEVIRPAIELAKKGYVVNPLTKYAVDDGYAHISLNEEAAAIYTNDLLPYELGEHIVNDKIVNALEAIIAEGRDGFYKGAVAEAIVESVNAAGGIMTMEDLANYEIQILEPVKGTYRGYQVISSPLPSSGGTHLIQILNILENFDLSDTTPYSTKHSHLIAEAEKIAYQDRAAYMGDPNYVDVPTEGLISKEYAAKLAGKIDMEKAQEYTADDPWAFEGNDTQHLSVADKDGNMIGITMSINYYWGSQVYVDGCGFYMNNHMNDFDPEPNGPNSVAAGKKPLSSMSPTVVLNEDGSPFMVLGCPGGSSIFVQVAQVIVDVIDFGMEIQDAVDLPRIVDNTSNTFRYTNEGGEGTLSAITPEVIAELQAMGHVTECAYDQFGYIQAITYGEDGKLYGAADVWADGRAVGF
ncbi:MAG: gamma-glutamyltransferase [Clostridia bacterium]|nr:gamma-glutamyltransferase [Clostridia bacterium]